MCTSSHMLYYLLANSLYHICLQLQMSTASHMSSPKPFIISYLSENVYVISCYISFNTCTTNSLRVQDKYVTLIPACWSLWHEVSWLRDGRMGEPQWSMLRQYTCLIAVGLALVEDTPEAMYGQTFAPWYTEDVHRACLWNSSLILVSRK